MGIFFELIQPFSGTSLLREGVLVSIGQFWRLRFCQGEAFVDATQAGDKSSAEQQVFQLNQSGSQVDKVNKARIQFAVQLE